MKRLATSTPVTYNWANPMSFVVGKQDTPQLSLSFDPASESNCVITGVGLSLKDDKIATIAFWYSTIGSDGSLVPVADPKVAGKPTDSYDAVLKASGPQEVVVGIGVTGRHHKGIYQLVLYTRDLDPASGLLNYQLNTYTFRQGYDQITVSWLPETGGLSPNAYLYTILTGIGLKSDSIDHVNTMFVQSGDLQVIPQTAEWAARAVAQPSVPDDPDLLDALSFASDAYCSTENDAFFAHSYRRDDGYTFNYGTKANWLSTNNYTVITDPGSQDACGTYFGVMGPAAGGKLVIAFRGTTLCRSDILTDLTGVAWDLADRPLVQMSEWDINGQTTYVHQGFFEKYQSLASSMQNEVKSLLTQYQPSELVITGHSLGGALATLCMADFIYNFLPGVSYSGSVKLVTYASPKVGDQNFISQLQNQVYYRVLILQDFIPVVPALGLTPSGKTIEFADTSSPVNINSSLWFPSSHSLSNYYYQLRQLIPNPISGNFAPSDPIDSISLVVTTGDRWFASTNGLVIFTLLGLQWGFNADGKLFQAGDTSTLPLTNIPAGKKIEDLLGTWLTVELLYPNTPFSMGDAWFLESITVVVNKSNFCQLKYNKWFYDQDRVVSILGSTTDKVVREKTMAVL